MILTVRLLRFKAENGTETVISRRVAFLYDIFVLLQDIIKGTHFCIQITDNILNLESNYLLLASKRYSVLGFLCFFNLNV